MNITKKIPAVKTVDLPAGLFHATLKQYKPITKQTKKGQSASLNRFSPPSRWARASASDWRSFTALSFEATTALRRMRRRRSIIAACYSQAELWP
jgi:hypothetical protein